jgi:hypothetical protein
MLNLNFKKIIKKKTFFSYNCFKYILLDYDLSLEFGTYKLINIFFTSL